MVVEIGDWALEKPTNKIIKQVSKESFFIVKFGKERGRTFMVVNYVKFYSKRKGR